MADASMDELRQLLAGESERTRHRLEALVAQLEDRLIRMERTGRIALTETRSLATKLDRLAPHRRTA
jgi:hypothetical protein